MTLSNNEMIDVVFETLIKVMIKNEYDCISIDQLIAIKHEFKIDPIEKEGENSEYSHYERLKN